MLRTARWVTGSFLRDLVLFALVWGWILQLLIPFADATGIPSVRPFAWFVAVLFAIDLAIGNLFGRIGLKAITLVLFVFVDYYAQYSMIDLAWLSHWFTDMYHTVGTAFGSNLDLLPESGRTTVFFFALWMFQSFYRQSLGSRIWMFVFLVLGAVGLGIMDSFFVTDAALNIVLFIFLGLLILAFMQLPAIERIARMPRRMNGWPIEWMAWTLILSLIFVSTSLAAPKADKPAWPDPVTWMQKVKGDGSGVQKIGYGNDDSRLGGPFQMDDQVVFTVITSVDQYYRGETKAVYTGKGWLSGAVGSPVPDLKDIKSMQHLEDVGVETKPVTQTYSFKADMAPVVFSQYRMTGVEEMNTEMSTALYSDIDSRLSLNFLKADDSYKVTSEIPYYDEDRLKQAPFVSGDKLPMGMRPYLTLPVTLPERVKKLAQDVTADKKTPYDKAQAIESYLFSNYRYETEDVPTPGEGKDFVDQFLFESKRGYCDHFSSSMVVMARSLGLPARWVKGFTKGDVDLTYRDGEKDQFMYVVKNKNAHSWPEVYFEGVGWVPFEPTSTFTMPRVYKPKESTLPLPVPGSDSSQKKDKNLDDATAAKTTSSFAINWKLIGQIFAWLLGGVLVLVVIFRRRLLTAWYLRRAYKGDGDVALNALTRLLLVLSRMGFKRTDDQTLREYAVTLASDHRLRGREMIPLAKIFERIFYGKQEVTAKESSQIRDLWLRIVHKAGRNKR
jgi:transglutaminase-like putative cysteine protease